MEKILKITDFIQKVEGVKSVLRHNWTKSGRQESVAEHTWRTVLWFMLLEDELGFEFDKLKVVKMLLVHDIPEMIDGDIPGFSKTQADKENEINNAKQMFNDLPTKLKDEYISYIIEFEEEKTPEAIIARTLDKLEGLLQHIDSGPRYWAEEERGEHMQNYPNDILSKLKDEKINKLWQHMLSKIIELEKEIQ